MIYCLVVDSKGNIIGTKTYEGSETRELKNILVVDEPLYSVVYDGLSSGTYYRYLDGDIVACVKETAPDIKFALMKIEEYVDNAISSFSSSLKLNSVEREQALIALHLGFDFTTKLGIVVPRESLVAYFKEFNAHYTSMLALRLRYIDLVEKAKNQYVLDRHVSNFLREIGDIW